MLQIVRISQLLSRVKSGAISYLGKVVSPITIQPSKPRLCINMMYLNLFMKDTPFNLDTLTDVPKTIGNNSFLTKLDDKSGYDNLFMSESSKPLLGFQWGGHYFCCNTLPFGWKNSAYVYHTKNLHAMSYLRNKAVSSLLYIDDRLFEGYRGELPHELNNAYTRAQIAIRLAVRVLVA